MPVVGIRISVAVHVGIRIGVGVRAGSATGSTGIESLLAAILVGVGGISTTLVLLRALLLTLSPVALAGGGRRKYIYDGHEHVCSQNEKQKIIELAFHGLDFPLGFLVTFLPGWGPFIPLLAGH
ncbi:MAG TPA: hypothetical protein VIW80_04125 [Pyrinomonadaceae bacterium]